MWYNNSVFYQIYTFGFCGAPKTNNGETVSRILKLNSFTEHFKRLNINAIYFCPVFESDAHGYDTRDYKKIDCRIGTNADFASVCDNLHKNRIRVVLDGVFNHVGRGFWAFRDVLEKREGSQYKDWFYINFGGNNNYNDGLWYEGWEGHYELVKLNLQNPAVKAYLLECVGQWMDEFKIDGLRLDVAYTVDRQFMRELRAFCLAKNPEFFLVGEMIHGDYNQLLAGDLLHSVTNYECYKGLYSSFNSMNMFEIGHSLLRQFGKEPWCLYTGKQLMTFADNHDVSRLATVLTNKNHIPLAFALLLAMPGIPCIYYGSEWGIEGNKQQGDDALRPCIDTPVDNELSEFVAKCVKARQNSDALSVGDFEILKMTNKQLVISRKQNGEEVIAAINADNSEFFADFNRHCDNAVELIEGEKAQINGGISLPPNSAMYIKI